MIDLIEEHRTAMAALCHKFHVARLEIFGSAADDTFDEEASDLDFLVEFLPGQSLGPWMSVYFDLKSELEQLFGHGVDLVMSGALKNPYFIREVNRTRRLVYAS